MSKALTISIKPSINWNMTDGNNFYNTGEWSQTSCAYDINNATFNIMAGVSYNFGPGFNCVKPYNQAEIDALNGQINSLRSTLASPPQALGRPRPANSPPNSRLARTKSPMCR